MDCILSDIYVFQEILKYLNLKELLVLVQVSTKFRFAAIKHLQWNYKEIEAYKTHKNYILTKDFRSKIAQKKASNIMSTSENRILLSHQDFWDFLNINYKNIRTLVLHYNEDYKGINRLYDFEDKNIFKNYKFDLLEKLDLNEMELTKDQLLEIIDSCVKLKEFSFKSLLEDNEFDSAWIEKIPLNTSDSRRKIKCVNFASLFLIDGYYNHREQEFLFFEHLITEASEQTHVVKLLIEQETNIPTETENINNQLNFCEELAEGQICHTSSFKFLSNTLNNLVNLRRLTVVSAHYINFGPTFFTALNTVCKSLEYLKLEYCGIQEFLPIVSIKEIELNYCFGATWKDLKVILAQQDKLETFSSISLGYQGEFEYFKISEQLKNLCFRHCDIIHNDKINLLNFKNLTTLQWVRKDVEKQTWINATNLPNLLNLEVRTESLMLDYLNDFKYLKKFTLNLSENLKVQEFMDILQLPSLMDLKFYDNPMFNFMDYEKYLESLRIESNSWKTNLLFLDLCFNPDCECYFDFCANLLAINSNLQIRIKYHCKYHNGYDEDDVNVLSAILYGFLNSAERTGCLKSLNICGYNIDLEELKENFDQIFEDVKIISQDNLYGHRLQYILLKNDKT